MEVNTDKLNKEEIELLLAHMEKDNAKTLEVDSSDSDESFSVSVENAYSSPSGTIADSLPSTSQNYQQSPLILKRNLECSEGIPNHGQELPFSVGDVSFESSQNLDNDDLLQEILGEIAEGTPQHK